MTEDEMSEVYELIDCEGFDYAFTHCSDFTEIDDREFHKLRKAYVNAAEALGNYVGWNC